MKFKHISKNQVFKNDVITVFEETLALPNDNVVTWTFTGKKENCYKLNCSSFFSCI